ncbi:MAG: glycosyl hydrolase family 18 protein [Patescibacteria group bacterium]
MTKIISLNNDPKLREDNIAVYLWKLYKSLNLFLKIYILTAILITIVSFFFVGNKQIFTPHAVTAKKLSEGVVLSPLQRLEDHKKAVEPISILAEREVIGFLPSWTVAANTDVNIENLTQLIYFGLNVSENGDIVKYDESKNPTLEWHYFNSDKFTILREKAKKNNTEVLIAFKMFDNEVTDNLVSDSASTNYFIKQAIALLKQYDLDGINLDIEYFTDSDFPTSRYLNGFLAKLRDELKKTNPKYKVSLDVNATVVLTDSAYDMVKIGELADEVILMAYDYRVASSQRAGPVAPINGLVNEHSITESINSLVGRVPLEKVILGIPLYGYEWQTLNKNHKSTAVPGSGALATHKRVNELLETRKDIKQHWDKVAMSPWLVYSQSGAIKQIYYEDDRSLKAKLDFVNARNLAGVSLWALGYEGKYKEVWDLFTRK